ncbi:MULTISPECIES: chemotaxis protein [unclassified Campylobacter]|uniref:chemotaxis protein n=1 Tax=unclassified Campylobacter TaxID=2593542 RepID=UPI003D3318F0
MQSDLAEVIFKYLIIIALVALVFLLGVSGFMFYQDKYSEFLIQIHAISGIMLVTTSFIHAYIKKKKIKKLTSEFANALRGKKVELECNTTRFIEALKDIRVNELSRQFNADVARILNDSNIKVKSKSQTLQEICKANDEKMFYLFVVLMEGIFKSDKTKHKYNTN